MANIEQGPKRKKRQPDREQLERERERLERERKRLILALKLITSWLELSGTTNEVLSKALEVIDLLRSQEDPNQVFSDFNNFMRGINNKISELDKTINSELSEVEEFFPNDPLLERIVFRLEDAGLLWNATLETLVAYFNKFKDRIREEKIREEEIRQFITGVLIEFKKLGRFSFGRNGNHKDGDVKPRSDGKNE
jgi:transcription termination factor NusB